MLHGAVDVGRRGEHGQEQRAEEVVVAAGMVVDAGGSREHLRRDSAGVEVRVPHRCVGLAGLER